MSITFDVQSGKNWYQYDGPVQKQLLQCVSDGETTQELKSSSGSIIVNLADMTQEKKTSGDTTSIRCITTDDDGDNFVWTVTDLGGNVTYLGAAATEALEAAHQKKRVRCTAAPYTFNLKKMLAKVKGESDHVLERVSVTSKPYSGRCKAVGGLEPVVKADAANGGSSDAATSDAKPGSKRKKADTNDGAATSGGDAPVMKSVVLKSMAPVDPLCPAADSYHVFCEDGTVWDCMLNQTNIGSNNNKFYMIQLLEADGGGTYSVWLRWGRVGFNGQNGLSNFGANLDGAKGLFAQKFSDKTRNQWVNRANFMKVAGKYDLVKLDYAQDEPDAKKLRKEAEGKKKVEVDPCKLEKPVQDLIELICNVKAMETAVMEMQYDTKKSPLGKLTEQQIRSGYEALKRIDEIIRSNNFGKELQEACSQFYTRIPHNFGMRPPTLIRTTADVRLKLDLLEALGDIQLAMKLIGDDSSANSRTHPADSQYRALDCELRPLAHSDSTYKLIDKYVKTTHGHTHSGYKLRLLDVFAVEKTGEKDRFVDHGNRMLLWHGSRLTNWAGILGAGLKIAPPEAPSTGYMFGKGLYFADMVSKSANYCFANRSRPQGILLLSEVSVGKCNELLQSNYRADLLPKGKHSTKGVGLCAPQPETAVTMDDGVVVPIGPGKPVTISGAYLQYNEYIVYNVAQVRMRYVLRVQFDY